MACPDLLPPIGGGGVCYSVGGSLSHWSDQKLFLSQNTLGMQVVRLFYNIC